MSATDTITYEGPIYMLVIASQAPQHIGEPGRVCRVKVHRTQHTLFKATNWTRRFHLRRGEQLHIKDGVLCLVRPRGKGRA
jgi:hypothetical protein